MRPRTALNLAGYRQTVEKELVDEKGFEPSASSLRTTQETQ